MRTGQRHSGFTLVELLVALLAASVVLAAVATLAGATTCAQTVTDQMGRERAELLQVSARLSDFIKRANAVTAAAADGFTLWHDVNGDGVQDADELTTVSRNASGDTIIVGTDEIYPNCENVEFVSNVADPNARFISVWFDLEEGGQTQRHSICARLRAVSR